MRRIAIVTAATAVLGALGTASAFALWQSEVTATAPTSARSVPAPEKAPTVAVAGNVVTVTFPAKPSAAAVEVRGFRVVRYKARPVTSKIEKTKQGDAEQQPIAKDSTCSSPAGGATSCTETVAAGSWEYTVRYVVGDSWVGPDSPRAKADVTAKAADLPAQQIAAIQPATPTPTPPSPESAVVGTPPGAENKQPPANTKPANTKPATTQPTVPSPPSPPATTTASPVTPPPIQPDPSDKEK